MEIESKVKVHKGRLNCEEHFTPLFSIICWLVFGQSQFGRQNKPDLFLKRGKLVISRRRIFKKLNVSDSSTGLTTEQQTALTERFKSEKTPITLNQVSDEFNKEKSNKSKDGNGGIIAAIVIVGLVLAVVIGVVIHKNKRKDYY